MAVRNSLASGKCVWLVSAVLGFVHDEINWLNRLAMLFIGFCALVCGGGSMTSVPPLPSFLTTKLFAKWLPARVRSTTLPLSVNSMTVFPATKVFVSDVFPEKLSPVRSI